MTREKPYGLKKGQAFVSAQGRGLGIARFMAVFGASPAAHNLMMHQAVASGHRDA
jgi:hypothetical protein